MRGLQAATTTAQSQDGRNLGPSVGNASNLYRGDSCDTSASQLQLLQLNKTTGLYDVLRSVSQEEYEAHSKSLANNQKRRLSFQSAVVAPCSPALYTSSGEEESSSFSVVQHQQRTLQDLSIALDPNDPDAVMLGLECPCSPLAGVYCPVGQHNCRVDFANAGRFAVMYMKKIVHRWDDERYDQSLNETLDRMAQQQYNRQVRLERLRAYQETSGRVVIPRTQFVLPGSARQVNPTDTAGIELVANRSVVVLKTRKYKVRHQELVTEDQEEELCAICLVAFQEGDRVGNVRCEHVFHSACLKSWIKRKNHCPLCKMNNMATPQTDDDNDADGAKDGDDISGEETDPSSLSFGEETPTASLGEQEEAASFVAENEEASGVVTRGGDTAVTGLERPIEYM